MINRVILVGNLTRDPEAVATSGRPMTKLRLATNSYWKDAEGNRQEAAEFHGVVTFGRLAEVCAEYCHRGQRIYVEGRLRTRDYVAGDGTRRFSTEIVAEAVRFLDGRTSGGEQAASEASASVLGSKPASGVAAA